MAVQSLLFEIPKEEWHRVVLVLLGTIYTQGDGWRWIEGRLEAPSNFVNSARVARDVEVTVSREKPRVEKTPDAEADFGYHTPQFVTFEGFTDSSPKHENSCMIALNYAIMAVRHAFSGKITVYRVEPGRGFPWQAWVEINEHVTISWDEERGGTRAVLEPLIQVCQALELKAVVPA